MILSFKMKQTLFYGDLCVVDGYRNRVWEVTGFTLEQSHDHNQVTEAIVYNLSCVMTPEWTVEEQSDVTLVCKQKYAFQFVKELDIDGEIPSYASDYQSPSIQKKGRVSVSSINEDRELRKPHIYPNTINGLLEQLADLKCSGEMIGEIDEALQKKIDRIKMRLAEKQKIRNKEML